MALWKVTYPDGRWEWAEGATGDDAIESLFHRTVGQYDEGDGDGLEAEEVDLQWAAGWLRDSAISAVEEARRRAAKLSADLLPHTGTTLVLSWLGIPREIIEAWPVPDERDGDVVTLESETIRCRVRLVAEEPRR